MAWRGEQITRGPNQSLGYDRATLHLGVEGSGMGKAPAGTSSLGQGIGGVSVGGQQWHPTLLYLFALIIGELIVFSIISQLLK